MAEPRFHVGDWVKFKAGKHSIRGIVKEDRGPIGIKGRRLYLIEFRHDLPSEAPSQIELPAEQIQLMENSISTK